MNINSTVRVMASYHRDYEQVERKASMATTITTESKSIITTKKSITSTVSSDLRRPSTPLSIAERFMSGNYKPQNTIITKVVDKSSLITAIPLTSTAIADTPINQHTDRFSALVSCAPPSPPPPAAAADDDNDNDAPVLFTLTFDSEPQDVSRLAYQSFTPHPLDNTHTKTRRNTKCNSGCSEMHNNKNNKRKSKANVHKNQHHQHRRHHHRKHSRNNKIDIIKSVANSEDVVPEISEKSKEGIWVSSCCFIQWAGSSKQDPILPLKHRHAKDADRRRRCCCCWGRRAWVMLAFLAVLVVTVLVFFFWPRIPLIRIEGAINTIPTKVTQTQQGGRTSNVAFESTWLLNITMDNRRNFFTTRFNRIHIIAKDAMTGLLIGKGLNNNVEAGIVVYLPGKAISTIQLPISVNYQARDSTDATFSNLMRACHTNTTMASGHHSLSIHFWFTLYLFGLDWLGYKPTLIATPATGGFFCPSVVY
ncbi:hypothetical protein MAM1_0005c00672 [Mucor ambiguus]|uniref:Late embryogenesis abundant protein LEA-2 subgroup domain-containing protein n=1 Tax=Mucor ambiguus TaxID=91626 RepID=A0A0C9LQ56_9FUNG|nr:hypothetical protein MAM1_0005c00672 [Mucor ambiguus]